MCEEKDPEVILCLGESKSNSTIYIYIYISDFFVVEKISVRTQ